MNCNTGELKTFALTGAPAGGGSGYTYVFKWWDGTVDASTSPTINKQLNVGGRLLYNVTQLDAYGRSITYNGTLIVNSPPVIIGSPAISANDLAFPFNTALQSTAYDPDHPGGVELSYAWYSGSNLISVGTTITIGTGTYQNSLNLSSVTADQTLTQIITDTGNGVTKINYSVRGFEPTGLQGSSSSISNSIISSANNLSEIIIGPGVEASFTSYAQDSSLGQLQFLWLAGTLNGWTNPFTETDTPPPLANGLYKSQITLPVSTEQPGLKEVTCQVTNLSTQQSILFDSNINLVSASAPTVTSISTDAPLISGGYAVSQSGFVHFSATASDPNNALLSYKWTFSQPNIVLYGRTVLLLPSDYSVFDESILVGDGTNTVGTGPLPIVGEVTVSDRFGQSTTVNLSQFVTTLVWPYTQVSPQTSGTGTTSLQKRYWGVSSNLTVSIDDLATFNTDFSSQRNQSDTFNPNLQYIYIIYPASFGPATITVDSVVANDWLLTVSTFNAVNYNVYRSAVPKTGSSQVVIS